MVRTRKAKRMKQVILLICILFAASFLAAQRAGELIIDGVPVSYFIDEHGDTMLLVQLEDVWVSSPRLFANDDEYKLYRRYRRYAAIVYPYAVEAIRIFREVEDTTDDLKKGKRKKYIRQLHRELKDEFSDPLKKLTKTQGMILIKMIEKELDTPMYELIRNLRNGVTAVKWNLVGSFNGYSLKDGYVPGSDPILDMVLDDFNISAKVR